jgi:hypothetical protein
MNFHAHFIYVPHYCHYCITGSPPGPVRNLIYTTPITATSLTIAWDAPSGFPDRYEVTYSYTVKRCSASGGPSIENISDVSMSSYIYILRNLNEDSRYTITVRAINTVGSTMATVMSDTLTAGDFVHTCSMQVILLTAFTLCEWMHFHVPINIIEKKKTCIKPACHSNNNVVLHAWAHQDCGTLSV